MTNQDKLSESNYLYSEEIESSSKCCCPPPCPCPCPVPPKPDRGEVRFIKRSATTNLPLAGAAFSLQVGSQLLNAVSTQNGMVDFGTLPAGTYQLQEMAAPRGFAVDSGVKIVRIDSQCNVTIDGIPAAEYSFVNEISIDLSFQKVFGIGNPLAGAQFTLFQNGIPVQIAVSNAAGIVNFTKLQPGIYFMLETAAPPGYGTIDTMFVVMVAEDGNVTIDGQLSSGFVVDNDIFPPRPDFLPVYERTTAVFGHGNPGCEMGVTFPSGETVFAIVDADGNWEVAVPTGENLTAGMVITAFQACSGIVPISEISTTVLTVHRG